MPRFNVSISFNLRTEIEPEGVYFDDPGTGGIEDFEEDSSWYTTEVTSDGGNLRFVVTADSEEQAYEKAAEALSDGQEVEDRNGFTWVVSDLDTEVEEIEIPMDLDRAKLLVTDFLREMEGMDDELKLAFGFLLEVVSVQQGEIRRQSEALSAQRSTVSALESQVLRLQGEAGVTA